MIKETIEYTDFKGVVRKEEFFFNLTKAEVLDMEMSTEGGMTEAVNKLVQKQDLGELIKIFKDLINKSYGRISPDGRKFEKSEAILLDFTQTNAYSQFYMKLATDAEAAAIWVNGIIPHDNPPPTTN